MSLAGLLTQDVERIPWESDDEDELGNPVVVWGDPVPMKGFVYKVPPGHDELNRDREVALSTWMLVLGPNEEVSHKDRFNAIDRQFLVDGTIHPVWNPRTQRTHHLEIQLRLVEEGAVTGS